MTVVFTPVHRRYRSSARETCVFPRAGNPTVHTRILPAWNKRPDAVVYNGATIVHTKSGDGGGEQQGAPRRSGTAHDADGHVLVPRMVPYLSANLGLVYLILSVTDARCRYISTRRAEWVEPPDSCVLLTTTTSSLIFYLALTWQTNALAHGASSASGARAHHRHHSNNSNPSKSQLPKLSASI